MGLNSLIGAFGILLLAQLGGLAFDKIDKSVPFIASSVMSFILIICVILNRKLIDNPIKIKEKEEII